MLYLNHTELCTLLQSKIDSYSYGPTCHLYISHFSTKLIFGMFNPIEIYSHLEITIYNTITSYPVETTIYHRNNQYRFNCTESTKSSLDISRSPVHLH